MTQIDQIIADALAGLPETHVAILAREVVRLRESPAVVVPELTKAEADSLEQIAIDQSIQAYGGWDWARLIMFGYSLASSRARAIPADLALGEGVGALRRFAERCAQRDHQPDEHIGSAKCVACEAEDVLRANQGGANHG
jgi:hypothetical protein